MFLTLLLPSIGLGCLHALSPCAHSWPMLVPFLARGRPALGAALLFGTGSVLSAVLIGCALGGALDILPEGVVMRAEEVTGGLLILFGALMALRPRKSHLGHLHGACEPKETAGCDHPTHDPARFRRIGHGAGLVLLGFFNMAIPCATNLMAFGLATSAAGVRGAVLVLGTYSVAASLVMTAILLLVERGRHLFERLRSKSFESWLVRVSGLVLVLLGLSLVLHWHEHH